MSYVLSFLSGKGGVTKTTKARAMAVKFRMDDWQTAVLDLDLGQNSFRKWNDRRDAYGHTPNLDVISGTLRDLEDLKASGKYHIIIVDGAAYGSRDTELAAMASNMVVVCCRFSLDDMESAVETMNALVLKGVPAERFCVVFSGVPEQRTAVNYANALEYMQKTPYFIANGFIEQKNCITDAQNMGLAMNEVRYPSVRTKVDQVLNSIVDRLETLTSE